jgi:hypothetical protein
MNQPISPRAFVSLSMEEMERQNNASKDMNAKLVTFLETQKIDWNNKINPLFEKLRTNFVLDGTKEVVDAQAYALAYKQHIADDISKYMDKRSKENAKYKKLMQERFDFYATGAGLKTNTGEKKVLLDGSLSEQYRTIELFDTHLEYLRASMKNLDSFGYTIKNLIDLMNYLGKG